MTLILKMPLKLKKVSKARPKSLILRIPATVREIMEFKADETINIKVCLNPETKEKELIITKKD